MSAGVGTCLWLASGAEAAAEVYVSLFEDARIVHVTPRQGGEEAFMVDFDLQGQRFTALNGGPHYHLSPAASIMVWLDTQEEIDRLWSVLLAGGTALRSGWLTDRWGVSWQILPRALGRLMGSGDPAAAARVSAAMMGMGKLDIAALEAAAAG